MSEFKEPVLYIPGQPGIIDIMKKSKDGTLRSWVNGHTVEQVQARYPGCVLGELMTVVADTEEMNRTPPFPITEEDFIKALECLPPEGWTNKGGCETFKMCEYFSGNITAIYARCGTKYYMMRDHATMTHDQILAAILNPREDSNNG